MKLLSLFWIGYKKKKLATINFFNLKVKRHRYPGVPHGVPTWTYCLNSRSTQHYETRNRKGTCTILDVFSHRDVIEIEAHTSDFPSEVHKYVVHENISYGSGFALLCKKTS